MFDDVKDQSPPQDTGAGQAPGSGSGQGDEQKNKNMPLGGSQPTPPQVPGVEQSPPSAAPQTGAGKVEDIFADTDRTKTEQPAKPSVFQPKAKAPIPAEEKPSMDVGQESAKPAVNIKRYAVLGIIILVVVVALGGGWYAFNEFFTVSAPVPDLEGEQNIEDVEKDQSESPVSEAENEEESNEQTAITPVVQPKDTDQDGLSDEEETRIGTDINSVDSDSDGLFDREEVVAYETDPLNPDTDGDGYMDGDEVRDGYDPKGAGKLYEIK